MKEESQTINQRVNLVISLDTSIRIDRECDKRGISKVQFIKESIKDKLHEVESKKIERDLIEIREEIEEMKDILRDIKIIVMKSFENLK